MEGKRKFTNTELGISYGLLIGAVAVGVLFALTNDPIYFSYIGFGLVIGLVIGSYIDSKKKAAEWTRCPDLGAVMRFVYFSAPSSSPHFPHACGRARM